MSATQHNGTSAYQIPGVTELRIATEPMGLAFLHDYVSAHFYERTGIRLAIDDITATEYYERGTFDLAFLRQDRVRELALAGRLVSLRGLEQFLIDCNAVGGPFFVFKDEAFGIPFELGGYRVSGLPRSHRFLHEPGLVLAVADRRVLETVDDYPFYLIRQTNLAFCHFMPLVEGLHGQALLTATTGPEPGIAKRTDGIAVRYVQADLTGSRVALDVSVSNQEEEPIGLVKGYLFGAAAASLLNRHAEVYLESRVNRVGPIAIYYFGPMLPGDRITRRIEIDPSVDLDLRLSTNAIAARLDSPWGLGGGSLCSTEPAPEPIPDPFPDFGLFMAGAGGTCRDDGCKVVHGD